MLLLGMISDDPRLIFNIYDACGLYIQVTGEKLLEINEELFIIRRSHILGEVKVRAIEEGTPVFYTVNYDTHPFVSYHKESGVLVTFFGAQTVEEAAMRLRDRLRGNWTKVNEALAPYRIRRGIVPTKREITKGELEHLYNTLKFPEIAKKLDIRYPPQLYALLDKHGIPRKNGKRAQ